MAAIKPRERDRVKPRAMTVRLAGGAGGHWLAPAVEMAARVSDDWPLPRDCTAIPWTCFPGGGVAPRRMQASGLGRAREFTVRTLRRWGVPERSDDIAIVVSELLTNALLHALPAAGNSKAGWPVRLGLLQPGQCVMCAVADPSPAAPVPRTPGRSGESGRGLHVIAALSDQWGYITSGDQGKVIWALFSSRPGVPIPRGEVRLVP